MAAIPRLDVVGISKRFGSQLAVDGLSFAIAPGEIVGFVGPNGAGKSTTLRVIAGLIAPDAGRVLLDGVDSRRDPLGFRARIGVLIESPAIYPMLTAFEHLAYVARLRGAYDPTRIVRALGDVGLDATSKKRVDQFSLGMKQRLAVAMALFAEPALLVLDEPMNGLDPSGIAELRGFLRALPGRTGTSVLMSSHLLAEIEQTCDRVLFIRQGRLLAETSLGAGGSGGLTQLWLRTADDVRTELLLRTSPLVAEASLEEFGVTCRLEAEQVGAIAPLLVAAGIAILEMTPRRPRLEDAYLARYAGDEGRLR